MPYDETSFTSGFYQIYFFLCIASMFRSGFFFLPFGTSVISLRLICLSLGHVNYLFISFLICHHLSVSPHCERRTFSAPRCEAQLCLHWRVVHWLELLFSRHCFAKLNLAQAVNWVNCIQWLIGVRTPCSDMIQIRSHA